MLLCLISYESPNLQVLLQTLQCDFGGLEAEVAAVSEQLDFFRLKIIANFSN